MTCWRGNGTASEPRRRTGLPLGVARSRTDHLRVSYNELWVFPREGCKVGRGDVGTRPLRLLPGKGATGRRVNSWMAQCGNLGVSQVTAEAGRRGRAGLQYVPGWIALKKSTHKT